MKHSNYIVLMLLITFLTGSAYGFAGMTTNQSIQRTDTNNTTESDQDILLLYHLVETKTVAMQSENKLSVQETLVFKNNGASNFSGFLRTWVQDGVEGISIERRNMMDGTLEYPIVPDLKDNIITWVDKIDSQSLPPLYSIKYDLPVGSKGTKQYVKKFFIPTLTKQPESITIKVTKSNDENIAIKDENGNSISGSGNPKEEDNSVLFNWEAPQFREITLDISKSIVPAGLAVYIIIGAVVLIAFSFLIFKKKNEKSKPVEAERPEESTQASEHAVDEDSKIKGKADEELEKKKSELLLKLEDLEKNYASGNLMDEEYEEQRRLYQEKVNEIQRKMEES